MQLSDFLRPVNRETDKLLALAFVSAAVTAQQIALMQVLGWMHWHHFAYLIVAIALLGFGIAGTVLSLARERLLRAWREAFAWLLLGTAVSIPIGVRLAQFDALAVDLPLVFFAPRNVWRLVVLCVLLLPPFFCGGLATGLLLVVNAQRAGRFYAASLAGAGVGGLAGLALVAHVTPPRLAPSVAMLALIAALWLWRDLSRLARAAAVLIAIGVAGAWVMPGELTSSQFKPLRRTLDLPGTKIVAQRPSVRGWIQVVTAPALRPSPAVSFSFAEEIPVQPAVFINGVPYGSLLNTDAVRNPQWLDFTTDAAAFIGFSDVRPRVVALLENGPGGWAALALKHSAGRVIVVEPNGALIDLLGTHRAGPLATMSGRRPPPHLDSFAAEWHHPAVKIARTSGRAFLQRTPETFDLIRFPDVGSLGGGAGLGAASEQFLLTRDAFASAWRRLSPTGVIAVTAWMDFPERNPLRLLATLAETIEAEGLQPRAHVAAIRGWATVTFLVRREPWSPAANATLRKFCDERGFDPLLLSDVARAEHGTYHAWQNPAFFDLVDRIVDGPRAPVYREHAFLLEPTTDRRPYFSQFVRWTRTERLREVFGARAMPFFELGSLVVAIAFAVLAALAVVCVVLPLARLGWRAPGKAGVLLYFGGLGAGFMLVEIGAMLQAHAWLGSPVLAGAVVITTLLIASGIGSLFSERLAADARAQRGIVALVALTIVITGALLTFLGPIARSWPLVAQYALLLVIVGSLGVAMGMAFPIGLRRIDASVPAHVPWAWAINGSVSVATPAGAMLLAMHSGFGALFVAAAVAYLVALLGAALSHS